MDKKTANLIYKLFSNANPHPSSELRFLNPLECLIAVLLSAQCTDKRVTLATEKLFRDFKTASDYANCDLDKLESYIKTINFYPTKAKNIKNLATLLCKQYNGQVPNTLEELVTLPGVGRKTAQVVLSEAFSIPTVPVDTHIFRVCNRIGIADAKNVGETESCIRKYFDNDQFINLHKLLVLHGRYTCRAKHPNCDNCILKDVCLKRI